MGYKSCTTYFQNMHKSQYINHQKQLIIAVVCMFNMC